MNRISVEKKEVGDPPITILGITIADVEGEWKETFGSPEMAKAFLRGVQAGAAVFAGVHISIPAIDGR